ncbi:MAG: hypothetical protein MUF74_11320 [Cypionkella sp.]|jgi:hypothetical protein|nr:hypothetical protein [Cypionkella sp.]
MKALFLSLLTALTLAGCASTDPVSRSVQDMTLATRGDAPGLQMPIVMAPRYDVRDIRIAVPGELRVSEANVFYPIADIVWRGEARGNRHEQVARIFQEAASAATSGMASGPAAVVEIEVSRFHSVTEKTRYTVGGTHAMHYILTVRDAQTGAVLDGPRDVVASVRAAGGAQAVAEDQMGRTQRVVVIERLTQSLRDELSAPTQDPLLVSRALGQPVAQPPAL